MKELGQDLLETATQRLVAEFQPEETWLFGSHAWGTPHDGSDVDLMVIVSEIAERLRAEWHVRRAPVYRRAWPRR